jgi:hypothetical protein
MKLRQILREVEQSTSKHFDNYSKENADKLEFCREYCEDRGYELDGQNDEEFFQRYGRLIAIPIYEIQIGQKKVESNVIDKKKKDMSLENYKPIHVFQYEGQYYLHDGHHRTVNLLNHDIKNVNGYVVRLERIR